MTSRVAILLCLSLPLAPSLARAAQWQQGAGFRSLEVLPAFSGKTGFTLLAESQTGFRFTNTLSDAKAAENQIRLNGSGVALGDIDGDGWCDIYLCRLDGPNALYRNLGNWKFEEVPSAAGAACNGQNSTGAVLADIDGDGDLDLLVNGLGVGTRLFFNNGTGQFTELASSGLSRKFGATTLALADIDGDGDLDLYVANYRTTTIRSTGFAVLDIGGKRMIRPEDRDQLEYTSDGRVLEHGEPDILYRNEGGGRFVPVSWTDGSFLDEDGKPLTKPPFDWGLSAMFRDLNQDGAPDLYVCNDFHSADKIWINDGKGRFRALPRLALRNTSTFSMSADIGDLNRDGFDDIFVADMLTRQHPRRLMQFAGADTYDYRVGMFEDRLQFNRNTLQLNRGDGTYAELALYAGLAASDWTWSAILLDVDLDGYEDLLCSTGHLFDTQDLDAEARIRAKGPWRRDLIPQKLLMFPKMPQPKLAFHNRRNLTFEENGAAWGFNDVGVAHGMALADLDQDGDLDVVVNNLNQSVGIYRNDATAPRIAIRLKGRPPNTRGIGARLLVSGGPVHQTQEMISGGRYLSGDDAMRVFAADNSTNAVKIKVTWRSGKQSALTGLRSNRIYEIDEATAPETVADSKPASGAVPANATSATERRNPTLFEDVSRLLDHRHRDEPYDDFVRQPLLPRKLSQLGPGLAWFDYDGDGWDDLIVGGGTGGTLAAFRNDGQGSFIRAAGSALQQPLPFDLTGIVGFSPADSIRLLLCGRSTYESSPPGPVALIVDPKRNLVDSGLDKTSAMPGPLALADIDGDGDLDLFVGARCQPGQWPAPASSSMLVNDGGGFRLDPQWSKPFAELGLVSGAVFADIDDDGRDDLLLATEWGPVRLFKNKGAAFEDVTAQWKLDGFVGWWNGVATGDFDGDGRLDFVASNWGWNTPYQSAQEAERVAKAVVSGSALTEGTSKFPIAYYGDLDRNGGTDVFEIEFDPESKTPAPSRSRREMILGLPALAGKFSSYAAFNRASFAQLVDETNQLRGPLKAPWLASTVFLNRGDKFVPAPLPVEAQFAPAFGVCVADFDGDLHDDIFLSQNFFEMQPTLPRLDAGRGLLLRGDGAGGFRSVPAQESGIQIYGEGRGAAVADFDGDGRLDLSVAQNGAATKLYRGVKARAGLRIRLQGPPSNPDAIGAIVRLLGESGAGPVRCIQAGSGYWSQDSHVLVLGYPAGIIKVRVRWPGGRLTESQVPTDAKEIVIETNGMIRSVRK